MLDPIMRQLFGPKALEAEKSQSGRLGSKKVVASRGGVLRSGFPQFLGRILTRLGNIFLPGKRRVKLKGVSVQTEAKNNLDAIAKADPEGYNKLVDEVKKFIDKPELQFKSMKPHPECAKELDEASSLQDLRQILTSTQEAWNSEVSDDTPKSLDLPHRLHQLFQLYHLMEAISVPTPMAIQTKPPPEQHTIGIQAVPEEVVRGREKLERQAQDLSSHLGEIFKDGIHKKEELNPEQLLGNLRRYIKKAKPDDITDMEKLLQRRIDEIQPQGEEMPVKETVDIPTELRTKELPQLFGVHYQGYEYSDESVTASSDIVLALYGNMRAMVQQAREIMPYDL
ncbi:MAG: hypothetical protein ACQEP8_02345 [Chlamydiota bacterium]